VWKKRRQRREAAPAQGHAGADAPSDTGLDGPFPVVGRRGEDGLPIIDITLREDMVDEIRYGKLSEDLGPEHPDTLVAGRTLAAGQAPTCRCAAHMVGVRG
jgi:hypothetical protein